MNRETFLRDYWAYYLMLEEKFIHTTNYVTLAEDNYGTYSNEYAALMQMIGGELDSFFKVYCGYAPTDFKKISDYYTYLMQDYPDVLNQKINVRSADIVFQPFAGWDGTRAKQSLPWWMAFDNIKHSRAVNKRDANQKNTLYLLGALYLLEMKYLKNLAKGTRIRDLPDKLSILFDLPGWETDFQIMVVDYGESTLFSIISENLVAQ